MSAMSEEYSAPCGNCGKQTSILEPMCSFCGFEMDSQEHGKADGANAFHRELKKEISAAASRVSTIRFSEPLTHNEETRRLEAKIADLRKQIDKNEKYI